MYVVLWTQKENLSRDLFNYECDETKILVHDQKEKKEEDGSWNLIFISFPSQLTKMFRPYSFLSEKHFFTTT